MKKVLTTTIIVLFIFTAMQISVRALNNGQTAEVPFEWGDYRGVYRYANDSDDPLSSSAYTGIYSWIPSNGSDDDIIYKTI